MRVYPISRKKANFLLLTESHDRGGGGGAIFCLPTKLTTGGGLRQFSTSDKSHDRGGGGNSIFSVRKNVSCNKWSHFSKREIDNLGSKRALAVGMPFLL